MRPRSTRSLSECACSLRRRRATGWEERSLRQQMWKYRAGVTLKIFDTTGAERPCFANQYVKRLNDLPLREYSRIVLRVLRAAGVSRSAENCCLQHPSSEYISSNAACGAALPYQHHQLAPAAEEELLGWLQARACGRCLSCAILA